MPSLCLFRVLLIKGVLFVIKKIIHIWRCGEIIIIIIISYTII